MMFKKSLKSIVIATFLLVMLLNIRPSLAMDDEKDGIRSNVLSITHRVYKKSLEFIGKGEQFEPGQLPLQSQTPFFEGLPNDDATLHIVSYLCTTEQVLEELSAIALTCKKGYQLTQHSCLWKPLEKIFFNHLPEEYIGARIEGKNLPPRALMCDLLQQLQTHQSKELKRLQKILCCRIPQMIDKDDQNFPLRRRDFLRAQADTLNTELKEFINLKKRRKYYAQEKLLERTNEELIQEFLKFMAKEGPSLNINLRGAITRLPFKSITHIQEITDLADKETTVRISLPCNKLRWVPKELFSIKDVHVLDLRNNLLSVLPPIEDSQEMITHLLLGNYNDYKETWFPLLSENGPYLRTQGNVFKTLPSCVLKLKNLSHLDLRSVGLRKFSQKELYAALPNLKILNLDLNDLEVLPQSTDKNRSVAVTAMGNSLQTLDWPTVGYVTYNYLKPTYSNCKEICNYYMAFSLFLYACNALDLL